MTDARILRERKKIINYDEDRAQPSRQRSIADVFGSRRNTRNSKLLGETDKENQRKRRRRDALGSCESDSDDGSSRPPAKRALRENDLSSDVIEDSDGDANAFSIFARPGKRPASRQPAQELAHRGRAAATRPSHHTDAAPAVEDLRDGGDDKVATARISRRVGPPTRTAAAAAKQRLKRDVAAGPKGRDFKTLEASESNEEGVDEDSGGSGGRLACTKSGNRNDSDVIMLDTSGSESDDEAGDDEMADARPAKRGGAQASRPKRACAIRAAARVRASAANGSKGGRKQRALKSEDSDTDDEEEDEQDEDYMVPAVVSKRELAGRDGDQRQSTHMKSTSSDESDEDRDDDSVEESDEDSSSVDDESDEEEAEAHNRGASGDSEDSDVRIVHDTRDDNKDSDGENTSSSSDGEDEDYELPVHRGHGRLHKTAARTVSRGERSKRGCSTASAKKSGNSMKRGKGNAKDKGTAEAGCAKTYTGPVEKILSYNAERDKYLVKLGGVSYRHTIYVSKSFLEESKPSLLRMFISREEEVEIDPDWLKVDRIIAAKTHTGGRQKISRQMLVKWRGLEYSDSTWEYEHDLSSDHDKAAIARFEKFNALAGNKHPSGNIQTLRQPGFELPKFCNGRSLRDYQQVSVRWMVNNYCQRRNCILGDEMGLGKTAQSISCLEVLRSVGGVRGPFLIVAPLSTLGHWQREIETWTEMNSVLFAGPAVDRAKIIEYEFYRSGAAGGRKNSRGTEIKFHVLLASYETLLKERSLLRSISWAAAIFDEAHRLKGINSHTRAAVEELDIDWLLLLTGTPIQNNMLELFAMLSLLDPDGYPSPEDFAKRFGGAPGGAPPSLEQIRALQEALAPILLRRMKEDVEELPQKEEVVVWVELTAHQRAYYRAMYEGQIGALLGGASSKNFPSMRNLAMELRKLCCHPVLCEGLEEDLKLKLAVQRSLAPPDVPLEYKNPELELLVRGSGKMVLLHKLLHKLRAEGRRVLIFSQFVIMLNVLEDYCSAVGFPVERIDGNVKSRDRQQAIDRFSAEDEGNNGSFVFLLSTRAGGQGITLTTADTCIIYDSDWNPQNDLQAMARCHRIGQKKDVTVYRLISRDTYEMALFNCASRKYGLDEAILGFSGGSDPESDSARIAELLRHGAHGLLADMDAGLRQGEAFASEDINQILAARTEKRQIGSRAGNTFSVATFAVDDGGGSGDLGVQRGGRQGRSRSRGKRGGSGSDDREDVPDKDYWRTLMPEAVAAHEARAAEGPVVLGPRKRKQVNYNDNKQYGRKLASSDSSDDLESEDAEKQDNGGGVSIGGEPQEKKLRTRVGKQQGTEAAEGETRQDGAVATSGKGRGRKSAKTGWSKAELRIVEDRLVALGPDRWGEVYAQVQPFKYTAEEVEAAGRAMWALYEVAAELAAECKAQKKKAETEALAAHFVPTQPMSDEHEEVLFVGNKAAVVNPPVSGIAAGIGGASAAPAAVAAATPPTPPVNIPDKFEEKLVKAISEMVPEFLLNALSGQPSVRRLLRDADGNLRHGKCMQELHRLMVPLQQRQEQQGAAETMAADGVASDNCGSHVINGFRACYLTPPITAGGFLNWWNRADDDALLRAVVQAGYLPGKPLLTIQHALRSQPLAGKVVQKQEPDQQPGDEVSAGAEAGGDTTACASGGPSTDTPAVALVVPKASEARGDAAPAEGGESKLSPAVPAPRIPGPNVPVQLSPDEWRIMLIVLSRRLNKIVMGTLEQQRRLAAGISKQPLMVMRALRPSGPLPNRDLAATPSGGADADGGDCRRPSNVTGLAARQAGTTKAIPANMATAAKQAVAVVKTATVATIGCVSGAAQPMSNTGPPVAGVAADVDLTSSEQPQQQQQHHHQHRPSHHDSQHHSHHNHSSNRHSQQQRRPADPERRTSVDPIQRQPDRLAGGPAAPVPAAGTSSKQGSLKQGTIPFTRVGGSRAQPKIVSGSGEGSGSRACKPAQAVASVNELDGLIPFSPGECSGGEH